MWIHEQDAQAAADRGFLGTVFFIVFAICAVLIVAWHVLSEFADRDKYPSPYPSGYTPSQDDFMDEDSRESDMAHDRYMNG